MRAARDTLRVPGFGRLAGAYTVNELGNWFGDVALALLVYHETGSALATAALFVGTRFVPAFLGPPLVARIEVLGARVALPALYAAEAVVFAALALLTGNFLLWFAIGLATVDGTLAVAARALTRATAAALLEPTGRLRDGNAVMNVGFTAAGALGPALAGAVVATLGVAAALALDAISFLLVAVALARSRSLPAAEVDPEPWGERFRAGLRYVVRAPLLRGLLAGQAAALVFFAAVIPIEVFYVKDSLGAGDAAYGALLASWGVGMVAGSLLFAGLRSGSLQLLIVLSTAAIGLAYLALALAPTLAVACLASVAGGIGNGVQWIALVSAVQEATRTDLHGRVLGLLESSGAAMPGLGFLLGGVIATVMDPRAAYAAAGVGVLVVLGIAAAALARTDWTPSRATAPAEVLEAAA
jgi:MFS family permease